jgi:hypothetical protein
MVLGKGWGVAVNAGSVWKLMHLEFGDLSYACACFVLMLQVHCSGSGFF